MPRTLVEKNRSIERNGETPMRFFCLVRYRGRKSLRSAAAACAPRGIRASICAESRDDLRAIESLA
jgi:hypothetical protein